jgi:5'-3' exonuclease
MILVDINQILLAHILFQLRVNKDVDETLIRRLIVTSLSKCKSKFNYYGKIVICSDSRNYWRKNKFSYYKSTRKKEREDSKLDWEYIFSMCVTIKDEIEKHLPYQFLQIDGAEADDIIAVITKLKNKEEKILIYSADKDFGQLQIYPSVYQYNPIQSEFIVQKDPVRFLKEHIIMGDRSDGIPNIFSQDDTFMIGKRQKSITKKNIEIFVNSSPEEFCKDAETLSNYNRNLQLIDFSHIPSEITDNILQRFNDTINKNKKVNLQYYISNNLSNLL